MRNNINNNNNRSCLLGVANRVNTERWSSSLQCRETFVCIPDTWVRKRPSRKYHVSGFKATGGVRAAMRLSVATDGALRGTRCEALTCSLAYRAYWVRVHRLGKASVPALLLLVELHALESSERATVRRSHTLTTSAK